MCSAGGAGPPASGLGRLNKGGGVMDKPGRHRGQRRLAATVASVAIVGLGIPDLGLTGLLATPQAAATITCGAGLTAYSIFATAHTGNFTGLFCVNAAGNGTYTQGAVQGAGTIRVSGSQFALSAFGTNLSLVGQVAGASGTYRETAPLRSGGTLTLTDHGVCSNTNTCNFPSTDNSTDLIITSTDGKPFNATVYFTNPSLSCDDTEFGTKDAVWSVSGADANKQIDYIVSGDPALSLEDVFGTGEGANLSTCYGSPQPFTTASGTPAPFVNGEYEGKLPYCNTGKTNVPCFSSAKFFYQEANFAFDDESAECAYDYCSPDDPTPYYQVTLIVAPGDPRVGH
jgi:hypothetical protein